jgi:5'-3' exonuclease
MCDGGGVRVHLVDGTYELFRCFHGAPRARNRAGREVGASRALLATLVALLGEPTTTHVAVAFDSVIAPPGSARGRTPEDLLASQAPLAADIVRALGLVLWPSGRFQADEMLATGARRFADEPGVEQIILCTTDLDLAQCVRGDRVVLLDRSRQRVTDEPALVARFGVLPRQLPDLFALVGDRSDGLPGVPGWGLRSATTLVHAFGSLAAIPDDPAEWTVTVRGAERLAASLRLHRREATLAQALLTMREDVPLVEESVADLAWPGADRAAIERLVAELDDGDAAARIVRWA